MTRNDILDHVTGAIACSALFAALVLCISALAGCSMAQPASRATSATYTFNFDFGEKAKNVNITNKMGDGALASADSTGSTETQTATPTLDIRPDVDVNYAQGVGIPSRALDGVGQAASAAKTADIQTGGDQPVAAGASGILESLTSDALATLKDYVKNRKSGTVTLAKKDGTTVTADCADGSCTFSDGTTVTAADCESCTAK